MDRLLISTLIRQLWLEFSKGALPEITDEDLELWTKCTEHSAIQSRLTDPVSVKEKTPANREAN